MRRGFALLVALSPILTAAQAPLPKEWLLILDTHGYPQPMKLVLTVEQGTLKGDLAGDPLEGTLRGNAFHAVAKDKENQATELDGTLSGDSIKGKATWTSTSDARNRITGEFTARPLPGRRAGPPRRHEFQPTAFHREFSSSIKPVLTIWPGDSVHTTTVDAGGVDERGVERVMGGNPQTGPFYVETAMPGDTLVVRLDRVRLNRDYAMSDDAIVPRALGAGLAARTKDLGKEVRWKLDKERGMATPDKPTERLSGYAVPVRPMLGCVGVAPGFAQAPRPTGDSGGFGGNMDFNEIVEGVTVYLRVQQPGALLFVGDGHALQGDGELNGNALETSMEVEFTVDVVPNKSIATPRVESATHIMAVGLAGSLDDAMRSATAGLVEWLEQDYGLSVSEAAQVLGTSAEYVVSEVADRNASIVGKLRKDRLAGLTPLKK